MSGIQHDAPVDGAASIDQADLMIDIAAGIATPEAEQRERRTEERYPYTALVAVAPVDETGTMHDAAIIQGKNISVGGICLVGRTVFAPGTALIMQLVRSNGSTAIVGARVQHCRYIGDMRHETGIEFTPLAKRFDHEMLLNDDGRLRLLHPRLRDQIEARRHGKDAPLDVEVDGD